MKKNHKKDATISRSVFPIWLSSRISQQVKYA